MAPNEPVTNEVETDALTQAEIAKAINLAGLGVMRQKMRANEVALKSLYMNWAFDKLNLNKYC